ncbi:ABC transporter permease [Bacillus thuringiensis]|uniref:FtsX-like permease family protein n=1 Tax=Bacillus TaxID=1386 RepID=UPI000BEC34D7|nr:MULTISPECIES: ABC transporter permease [Bacillus]MCU5408282.1 ABC transporter permease [Bacillus cereus]MDR4924398.1 ABC transporter permease [Bacillus thuringiensis]MED3526256.1 ABC transporter permease [Bacillus thuringiensis]PEC99042.1 ABC transporter permease [Bacillus thuringiensis]PEE97324.1 ABC transporter permease [Bacillus thuringiensis]
MTLFSLAKKNIKGNLNNYLLYFFSMVVSVIICYTFNSLLYTPEIKNAVNNIEDTMSQTSFVLIGVVAVFIGYSNAFFTKKRKKEVGLYSLLGVRKKNIARMLFFENVIIGAITLICGLILGILLSRLFIMLLLKLVGAPVNVSFSIPMEAVMTTTITFTVITIFTSLQSYLLIYRFKLIELFQADKKGEKVPKASIISAVVSIILLAISYRLMFNEMAMLYMPLVAIGTYLLFRSLTVYLLKRAQKNKPNYYKGINIIGTSHLLYRVKGNALILTVIALLTTFAIPHLSASFSEYVSTEKVVHEMYPFSYTYLSTGEESDNQIQRVISTDKNHPITAQLDIPIIQVKGNTSAPFQDKNDLSVNLISESVFHKMNKILKLGDIPNLSGEHAIAFKKYIHQQPVSDFANHQVNITLSGNNYTFKLNKLERQSISLTSGPELLYMVVTDEMFNTIGNQVRPIKYKTYKVKNAKTTKAASETLTRLVGNDNQMRTFYKGYTKLKESTGMKIFIMSSLSVMLIIATGSVIYFKQLTEAHSDKDQYTILRGIGVSKKEIRATIVKQTAFIFILPLFIGFLNTSMLIMPIFLRYDMDNIKENVLALIYAMTTYGVIYLVYYVLTINSYNRIVNK